MSCAVALGLMAMPIAAHADEVPVGNLTMVKGLTADQRRAIVGYASGRVTVGPAVRLGRSGTVQGLTLSTAAPSATRTATYYRGSALMWTRDSVDFSFNWSSVTRTSAYQTAGWIWPNIARNRGITKYYDTARNDRFRAVDSTGAGVPTPWGDVKIYSHDFVNRLSVNYNGAWSAWSD
jgi:hypothetical protein